MFRTFLCITLVPYQPLISQKKSTCNHFSSEVLDRSKYLDTQLRICQIKLANFLAKRTTKFSKTITYS